MNKSALTRYNVQGGNALLEGHREKTTPMTEPPQTDMGIMKVVAKSRLPGQQRCLTSGSTLGKPVNRS